MIASAQQTSKEPCLPSTGGGLALCSVDRDQVITVNRTAQAGAADKLYVLNNSRTELAVTARARPWTQPANGVATPNRRGALGGVSVSEESFTLAPGTRKELMVTLDGVPSSGYLYGALEVVGLPADLEDRKGVVAGHRLVSSLRYAPAAPSSSISTGALKVVGSGKEKTLTLAVRNTGNTLDPVTGRVKLKSGLGTKNSSVKATRILPGKSIRLGLVATSALKPGAYTATITLTQAKQKTTVTKKFTVRR